MKIKTIEQDEPTDWNVRFFCPGCKISHLLRTTGDERPRWDWNGSHDRPTFTPSVLVETPGIVGICHSYITDGMIKFLGDCTHDLSGQTVELPDL